MLRRYFLLPEQEQIYNKELARILGDERIPEDRKLKLYLQTLQKYLHYSKQGNEPIPVTSHKETPAPFFQERAKTEPVDVLKSIPKSYTKKAEKILKQMVENDITWTNDGTLVVNGDQVPSTSVGEIVRHMVLKKKHKGQSPKGFDLVENIVTRKWEPY